MKIQYSAEVAAARAEGLPLVALETSVLAQGLPYPRNLEAAKRCEDAIRREGAVPAAMAVIDGLLCCGLDAAQTERLARGSNLWKLGSRDLAVALARGATGGTTVSATCEMAAAAGISVFSTGGLGGVHRGASEHMDISQDLPAIARYPVAVVCAGAKSVLDLPKTLEVLETLAVPVIGVGTQQLPGFYTRETGITLEHSVSDAHEAANVLRARLSLGQGGLIFAVPPPEASALSRNEIESHLLAALADAEREGITGKAVTPYLLSSMVKRTDGRTLEANLALLENNAVFAGQLARSFSPSRRALTARGVLDLLARQYGVAPIELHELRLAGAVLELVPGELALRHRCIPVALHEGRLVIAFVDPGNSQALAELRRVTGYEDIEPAVATEPDILAALKKYYGIAPA